MQIPETRYAWNGDAALAFQVLGDGPIDLLYMNGYCSHLDLNWQSAYLSRFLRGLASHARLIIVDRRGYGLSESYAPNDVPPIETFTDDVLAVLDAAGSERAVFFASLWSGFTATFVAAAHPQRIAGLVLTSFSPTFVATDETPWTMTDQQWDSLEVAGKDAWGTPRWLTFNEPGTTDRQEREWFWRWTGATNSPGAAFREPSHWRRADVRGLLPAIQAPTLVLADRQATADASPACGRYISEHIPGAVLVEFDGHDRPHWYQGADQIIAEVGRFLAGIHKEQASFDRVLATVMFTDIIDSTAKAAELGDRGWHELVERHHAIVRSFLGRYRGVEVDTAGDGFFATFDGPARAIRCAQAIEDAVLPLGIEVRAGLHTGECETIDGKVGGIAVVIGARVGALAGPSEVLVSQTVRDLVAGSDFSFEGAGEHELKGVPDRWRLYRASHT